MELTAQTAVAVRKIGHELHGAAKKDPSTKTSVSSKRRKIFVRNFR